MFYSLAVNTCSGCVFAFQSNLQFLHSISHFEFVQTSNTFFGNLNSSSSNILSLVFLVAVAVSARNGTSLVSDFSSFSWMYQCRKADFFSLFVRNNPLCHTVHFVHYYSNEVLLVYLTCKYTLSSFRGKSQFWRHKDERDLALLNIPNHRSPPKKLCPLDIIRIRRWAP